MKRLLYIVLALLICSLTSLTAFGAEDKKVLPSGIAYSNIEKVIDDYVGQHKSTTAAVSVAVITGSDMVIEKAYGYSDIENKIQNDKDTVFEWGSCTKLLVWTSVMQLAEKGKINLNKDIRTYLPKGFLTKLKFNSPITMLNLMNHNAGWQETLTDIFIKDKENVKELGDALKLIEPEQVNEPRRVVAYSNWGVALAGYIVERISGQTFDDYVHEHIFKPLGMEHTALSATLSDNEWVAKKRREQKCYTTKNEPLGTNLYYLSLYPAGMATGTLGDFVKFGQAFIVEKGEKSPLFEKRETLKEMLSPSLFFADGITPRNCHGFWTDELGVPVLWHNGGTLGSTSWFAFNPELGTGIIILTNQRNESIYNCGLLAKVFGKYKVSGAGVSAKDISGTYVSSRSVFNGFAKPYSLISTMRVDSIREGRYSIHGTDKTAVAIGSNQYLMDIGGLKQFIIYLSTDRDGRKVLQLPASDYVEVNGYGVTAKYVLLILLVLSMIYGLFELISNIVCFLKHKNSFDIIKKFHVIVNASVVTAAIMFIYISVKLFSEAALIKDILWSIILNAVLALIPIAYAVFLTTRWRRLDYTYTKNEKIRLIITCIAGLIMTINVIFWQA